MASLEMVEAAAEVTGFVRTECVHASSMYHTVFDYPAPLVDGQTSFHWRVHVDWSKVPHVTYVAGHDGKAKRATYVEAIAFMHKVADDHPKSG